MTVLRSFKLFRQSDNFCEFLTFLHFARKFMNTLRV